MLHSRLLRGIFGTLSRGAKASLTDHTAGRISRCSQNIKIIGTKSFYDLEYKWQGKGSYIITVRRSVNVGFVQAVLEEASGS